MIYRFWLHPWYLLAIVFSVLLWYTDSDYTLGIFWPLCCLFLLWYTDSYYTLGIFWPLCCLFLYNIQILITRLLSFGHCVVCASMIYRFWLHPWYLLAIVFIEEQTNTMAKRYQGSNQNLYMSVLSMIYRFLITPLVSFGNCVVCSSMIYRFWLLPWYLLAIVFVCSSMIYRF